MLSVRDAYAQQLAELEGDAFQAAVCAFLGRAMGGFQHVPDKPQGDAGLDACSNDMAHAWCCYGPERDVAKTAGGRANAVVKKFSKDLRKLMELGFAQKQLVRRPNKKLLLLLRNQRISEITLLVNWFEDNRILGGINAAFAQYKSVSAFRCVRPDATVVIMGPKQVAEQFSVDEIALADIQQRGMVQRVEAIAPQITLAKARDFELKMDVLRTLCAGRETAVDRLAESWRRNWRKALAFEHELNSGLPHLHRRLEISREEILMFVDQLAVTGAEMHRRWPEVEHFAKEVLRRNFGAQYDVLVPGVANGEIARLIGECPIEWEAPPASV